MSYGIKTYDDQGYISLHSDYSSLVYGGPMTQSATPVRPVYEGDYAIPISDVEKSYFYDMGWLTQYTFTTIWPVGKIVPFYHPKFNGQEIAIIDIVNDGGNTWAVNLIFNGDASHAPEVFVFVDIKDVQNYLSTAGYGIIVRDADNDIVFNSQVRPLRVDAATVVTHPSSIKVGDRGTCSNSGGAECHINYRSDQESTAILNQSVTPTKLFHAVTSTYGGLAYRQDGGYKRDCGFLNLGRREYKWAYQSWSSFRGTIKATNYSTALRAGWKSDFAGAAYQLVSGGCDIGGILGALLGAFLVVFTGGAALLVIGGALAGFAVGSLANVSSPSLKAYEQDEIHDTNNPVTILMTDASYYGASVSQVSAPSDLGVTFTINFSPTTLWGVGVTIGNVYGYYDGTLMFAETLASSTTSYTTGGYTYLRGDYYSSYTDPVNSNVFFYYRIARI